MKKLIGIALTFGSYFPAHYGATVSLEGMQIWAFFMTMAMFLAGIFIAIEV